MTGLLRMTRSLWSRLCLENLTSPFGRGSVCLRLLAWLVIMPMVALHGQEYTRGIGVYPGDPKQDFSPVMKPDGSYRNLALHRPAWHSSAYDYNLTAQLVTDGIKDTSMPRWVATSTSDQGVLPRNEREWPLDANWVSTVNLKGQSGWVQVELGGGEQPLQVDAIRVDATVRAEHQPENWTVTISGSGDGESWTQVGRASGMARPGGTIDPLIRFANPARYRFYRIALEDPRTHGFSVGNLAFFSAGEDVHVGGPWNFTSAWMPAGKAEEWVYVDLGAVCTFDRIALAWIRRAAEGSIQVSDDAANWTTIQPLGAVDDIKLGQTAKGRYVRLLLTKPATPDGYILSELEVYGRGGLVPVAKPAQTVNADGRMNLAGGAWRVQRDSLVRADGAALSQPGFRDEDWVPATVPGTVLSSYYNVGALPDPNFGNNQLMISDSFFHADFWYRNEFSMPAVAPGEHVWLNFDGINWKAEVFLNGSRLGRINGGFTRARYDVTGLLHAGQKNALAVRIERVDHPGSIKQKTLKSPDVNGGVLGADNPTYHATIGWDWIPTMRGRDIGIWNNVWLGMTGGVTLEDPLVETKLPLPDTSRADVSVMVLLQNHEAAAARGTLNLRFGDQTLSMPVTLDGASSRPVKLDLKLQNPKLWWPAGYGDANLYPVELAFDAGGGRLSDVKRFRAGVRQFAYSEDGGILRMWINGRRFIPKGGNWGFGESMLRYRAREYNAAVRYHRDMHFNMIRNWVGQIGEDAFYEACDNYGVVVWQDFWLANPWDGPDPDNDSMFMQNADDLIRRIRTHPSVGLYCGRNEGYPPAPLDRALRQAIDDLHPGLHYISSSADDVVGGHGPYQAMSFEYYFKQRATTRMHSELGMPNIPTLDSLKLMLPQASLWPQNEDWGLHDFCFTGAQGGASFNERIQKSYGGADNAADWVTLAQFVNYEGHRAMFEAQSKNRMGLLMWMSHPAWPSFVWQTYDYYLEPTAGYFGAKKAAEPLHIQWNPVTEGIEVVNYSGGQATGLTASAEVLNLDGSVAVEKSAALDSAEDSVATVFTMQYPASVSAVHFLRLRLTRGAELVSENFYWRGTAPNDFRALRTLPKVAVSASTKAQRAGERWTLSTELQNTGKAPALMVRVKVVRDKSGDRILPALYSDNYVSLMPGEKRTLTIELANADTRGEAPRVVAEGFNVQ